MIQHAPGMRTVGLLRKLCVQAMSTAPTTPPDPIALPAWRAWPPIADHLRALRCVVAVARCGSAMRAAELVHLSQPAVTRAVLDLEASCGLPLFERGARGMVATPLGATTARRAGQLFEHLATGAAQAAALAPGPKARNASAARFASAVTPSSLRALLAVAACASESRAAVVLGVSQPAVNRALRALEHLAGTTVLQRSVRGTRLTEGGEALLRRVKLAVAEARALTSELAAWRGEVHGRVVIGALPLSVSLLLPQAVDAVRRRHPDIEITVIDGTYEHLMRQLRQADVDLVIGALRDAPAEVRQEQLVEEPLAILARRGHPCLERRALKLADLLAYEWVLPLPGTPASRALHRLFAQANLNPPDRRLEASSAVFTRGIVQGSDRLALTSLGQALEDERTGLFARVPLDLQPTVRPVGVAMRDTGDPSPDVRAVVEALREAAHDLVPPAAHKQNEYAGPAW